MKITKNMKSHALVGLGIMAAATGVYKVLALFLSGLALALAVGGFVAIAMSLAREIRDVENKQVWKYGKTKAESYKMGYKFRYWEGDNWRDWLSTFVVIIPVVIVALFL